MQNFTDIPSTRTLSDSLAEILNNDKTALSLSSGTAFPTTNLQLGMPCYRSDQQKLYILTQVSPSAVWKLWMDFTGSEGKAPNAEAVDGVDSSTIVPNTRQIIAGTGLSGGGDLSANRTLSLAAGAAAANLGYTPVNKAGDTITGRTVVSVPSGKQFTLDQWGDASSADGGQTMIAGNAYFDKTSGQAKYSNSHGTIGAVGIRFNSPSWNEGSLFTAGSAGSTADTNFTPLDALRWDSSGRVLMPYQPAFFAYKTGGHISGTGNGVFDTTRFNRGGHYSTSNGRFTAPVSGVYFFTAIGLPLSTVNYPFMYLFKNGSRYSASSYVINADQSISISAAIEMSAGDYVTVYYIDGSEANYSHFSGFLIG